MQAITDSSKSLRVEVRGDDVVGHAGNVIPRMLADATGRTSGLSAALSRPEVLHDRGVVLCDVAVVTGPLNWATVRESRSSVGTGRSVVGRGLVAQDGVERASARPVVTRFRRALGCTAQHWLSPTFLVEVEVTVVLG